LTWSASVKNVKPSAGVRSEAATPKADIRTEVAFGMHCHPGAMTKLSEASCYKKSVKKEVHACTKKSVFQGGRVKA
jgi:hypothetical protein